MLLTIDGYNNVIPQRAGDVPYFADFSCLDPMGFIDIYVGF